MTDQDELKIDVEEKQLALSLKEKIVIDARPYHDVCCQHTFGFILDFY
jgi:hypothetical protein